MYYFVSDKNFDKQTLYPEIPFSRANNEDNVTKRICVSKSIVGCLTAIEPSPSPSKDNVLYVHWCESDCVIQPTIEQVEDSPFTGEEWIIEPVVMNYLMKIKITNEYHSWANNMPVNVYTFELV